MKKKIPIIFGLLFLVGVQEVATAARDYEAQVSQMRQKIDAFRLLAVGNPQAQALLKTMEASLKDMEAARGRMRTMRPPSPPHIGTTAFSGSQLQDLTARLAALREPAEESPPIISPPWPGQVHPTGWGPPPPPAFSGFLPLRVPAASGAGFASPVPKTGAASLRQPVESKSLSMTAPLLDRLNEGPFHNQEIDFMAVLWVECLSDNKELERRHFKDNKTTYYNDFLVRLRGNFSARKPSEYLLFLFKFDEFVTNLIRNDPSSALAQEMKQRKDQIKECCEGIVRAVKIKTYATDINKKTIEDFYCNFIPPFVFNPVYDVYVRANLLSLSSDDDYRKTEEAAAFAAFESFYPKSVYEPSAVRTKLVSDFEKAFRSGKFPPVDRKPLEPLTRRSMTVLFRNYPPSLDSNYNTLVFYVRNMGTASLWSVCVNSVGFEKRITNPTDIAALDVIEKMASLLHYVDQNNIIFDEAGRRPVERGGARFIASTLVGRQASVKVDYARKATADDFAKIYYSISETVRWFGTFGSLANAFCMDSAFNGLGEGNEKSHQRNVFLVAAIAWSENNLNREGDLLDLVSGQLVQARDNTIGQLKVLHEEYKLFEWTHANKGAIRPVCADLIDE